MQTQTKTRRIQQLQERVAKHQASVDAERAELIRLTDERRKMMSLRNPRGRHIMASLKATQGRLTTAENRLAKAEEALEEVWVLSDVLSARLEYLRIDTVLAQQALEAGDADKVAYYLPRIARWAQMTRANEAA